MTKESRTEMRRVKLSTLRVHPVAQRELNQSRVDRIKRDFNLSGIGTLHCVEYEINGKRVLLVVDGQHRMIALIDLGYGDMEVNVMVHLDAKDDAASCHLFRVLNDRWAIPIYDKYRTGLVAGYPVEVGVDRIVRYYGLRVSNQQAQGAVCAISSLMSAYKKGAKPGEALSDALDLIDKSWGFTPASLEGKIIDGVALLCSRFNGELDRKSLAKKMSKFSGGPAGVLGGAKGFKDLRGGTLGECVAVTLLEVYNKGKREKLAL
jgi:hypothetical protein